MTPPRRVLRSTNSPDDTRCVDVFVRTDATFGFEEYRRDAEDPRGWFPIGGYGDVELATEAAAADAARAAVDWLAEAMRNAARRRSF